MNQVFISNHMAGIQANADHALWASLVHTAGAADGHDAAMVGIWDPYGQRFLDGTSAALGLINPQLLAGIGDGDGIVFPGIADGTGIVADADGIATGDEAVNITPTSPTFLNRAFQIVQAMPSGNAIASPIIHTGQLKRLKWDVSISPAKHKLDINTDAGLDLGATVAADDEIVLILTVRFPQDIAFYEAQINPGGSVTNITPTLSAAFDNPKRLYKVTYTATDATAATQSAGLVTAINAHSTVSQLVTAADDGDGITVEANFYGMIIDATVTKNGDNASGARTDEADMRIGVGSYAEVISAEKKAQYSQGHFNRMYLPTGGVTSASATAGGLSSATVLYNRLTLEYTNSNNVMPGFNSQGNTSVATLYVPKATYAAQATQKAVEATFGLIDATAANEFNW
jgi:hypothetical protein